MAAKVDPLLVEILKRYDADPKQALWDCHGVLVIYHKHLERIAAKAGIWFDPPQIIEAKSAEKIVAICVVGHMGDERTEWSIGEAAPANNKNGYPYAMAEKRAKDRVILKLVGLAGFIYSEEEADDFKNGPKGAVEARDDQKSPAAAPAPKPTPEPAQDAKGWLFVARDGTHHRELTGTSWFARVEKELSAAPKHAGAIWDDNQKVGKEIVDSVRSELRATAQAKYDHALDLVSELTMPFVA